MQISYAYLIGDLIASLPFILIFILKPKLRKEMVVIGAGVGLLALATSQTFIQDYWRPVFLFGNNFRIEEFLYGFFIGGFAAGIYPSTINGHVRRVKSKRTDPRLILLSLGIALFIFLYYVWILGLSSMYTALLLLIILGLLEYFRRQDLFIVSAYSGALTAIVTICVFTILLAIYPDLINQWWKIQNLSGIYVFRIPIEEIYWAFLLGFVVGPIYELHGGYIFLRSRKKK